MMEFLAKNAPYVVLACVMVIWAGIAWYLWRMDVRIRNLEQRR
jgi:CcmD family protein